MLQAADVIITGEAGVRDHREGAMASIAINSLGRIGPAALHLVLECASELGREEDLRKHLTAGRKW